VAAILPKPRRVRRTWPQRLLIGFNLFVITACLVTAGGLYYAFDKLGDLPRINLSHVITPEPDTDDGALSAAQNFLLVGSDSRANVDPSSPDAPGMLGEGEDVTGQRSDTIMILRIEPSSNEAALLSLPRDLWVTISGTGRKSRINSAFSQGADVLIETIEENFEIPIHHYVEVDFIGFQKLVDAIGGVDVYFPAPARDGNTGLNITVEGCVTLNGEYGLAYVRSRHYEALVDGRWRDDPRSDLSRIDRQQYFIRRSLERAIDRGIRSPSVLNRLLDVATESVTLDSELTVRDMARLGNQLRRFDPASLQTFTMPNIGTTIGQASVLLPQLDTPEAQAILSLFRTGATPEEPAPGGSEGPVERVDPSTVAVRVLNGSGRAGLAVDAAEALSGVGFEVVGRDNAERFDYQRTLIRYEPDQRAAAETLAAYLAGGADLEETPSLGSADVALVLGTDFTGVQDEPTPTTTAPPPDTTPDTVPEAPVEPEEEPFNPFVPPADATC